MARQKKGAIKCMEVKCVLTKAPVTVYFVLSCHTQSSMCVRRDETWKDTAVGKQVVSNQQRQIQSFSYVF